MDNHVVGVEKLILINTETGEEIDVTPNKFESMDYKKYLENKIEETKIKIDSLHKQYLDTKLLSVHDEYIEALYELFRLKDEYREF